MNRDRDNSCQNALISQKKPKKNIIFIGFLWIMVVAFFIPERIQAQFSEEQVEAALVYHFCSYVTWPEDYIGTNFRITVLSHDSTLVTNLRKIIATRKILNRQVLVELNDTLDVSKNQQVLIADREHSRKTKELYELLKGTGTLIITDQSTEPLYVMINFVHNRKDGKISYEINSQNIEFEKLTYAPDLLMKGGSVLDMKQLYARTYELLTRESEKLRSYQLKNTELEAQYNRSQDRSDLLKSKLDSLDRIMKDKEHNLSELSEGIRKRESQLAEQASELGIQKLHEEELKGRLNRYVRDILHSKNQLDSINFSISEKEKTIHHQEQLLGAKEKLIQNRNQVIDTQSRSMRRLILFLIALGVAVSSLLWAYYSRRRMNQKLEKLVQKRTQELKESQEYFRNLFENSPVPVLEENMDGVLAGINDLGIHSDDELVHELEKPGKLMDILSRIRILNLNDNVCSLFYAPSKEYLRAHILETIIGPSHHMLVNALIALKNGQTFFESETTFGTFGKGNVNVLIRWIMAPPSEFVKTRILITYVNVTQLKKIENELKSHRDNLEMLVRDRTAEVFSLNEELISTNDALTRQKKELENTLAQLRSTQAQLVQAEKMASLGMLSAGIAHEINNPINFISAGNQVLEMHFEGLLNYTGAIADLMEKLPVQEKKKWEKIRNEFNPEETQKAVGEVIGMMTEGIQRTSEIIKSLNSYSRKGEEIFTRHDIRSSLTQSLLLLKNKYKSHVEIVQEFSDVPEIECIPVKVSQVFVNLLSNSIDAIQDKGRITIRVEPVPGGKFISTIISDDGRGIPEKDLERIYDPFYTTKEVGKGTGLGLYIVYQIIQQHKGKIVCNSTPEKGTNFHISWPIDQTGTNL